MCTTSLQKIEPYLLALSESNGSSVGPKEDNDGVFSSVMYGVDLSEGWFFARTLCLLCAKKSSSEEAGDGPRHRDVRHCGRFSHPLTSTTLSQTEMSIVRYFYKLPRKQKSPMGKTFNIFFKNSSLKRIL